MKLTKVEQNILSDLFEKGEYTIFCSDNKRKIYRVNALIKHIKKDYGFDCNTLVKTIYGDYFYFIQLKPITK
mgnify:FL=1